jgi:hypothetical protein
VQLIERHWRNARARVNIVLMLQELNIMSRVSGSEPCQGNPLHDLKPAGEHFGKLKTEFH